MNTKLKIILPIFLLILSVGLWHWWPAEARPPDQEPLPGKDGNQAKVSHDLIVLHDEYESQRRRGGSEPFKPSNSLMRVFDDRVMIDAVATGDASLLVADLEALGLQNAATFGPKVSGQLPISAIEDLAALDSLRFIRPAYAATGGGVVTGQGGATTGSGMIVGSDPVKGAEEQGNTAGLNEADSKSSHKCDRR